MIRRFCLLAPLALALALGFASPAGAAEPKPAWQLSLTALPTNFSPESKGATSYGPMFQLIATNVGGAATSGTVTLRATLPADLPPLAAAGGTSPLQNPPYIPACEVLGLEVLCTVSEPVHPGRWVGASIAVEVGALNPGETREATAIAEGGGTEAVSTSYEVEIEEGPPPFGFLSGRNGLSTLFIDADATPAVQAGSHPGQATISVGFPIKQLVPETSPAAAGHLRALITELPPGLIGNPSAVPRCTEAELMTEGPGDPGCPDESQIGLVTTRTTEATAPVLPPISLYNMVPPPGVAAEFAFNFLNFNIFVHLHAKVRTDGDFGVSVETKDVVARYLNPIMSAQAQVWGDPSAGSHDEIRSVTCTRDHGHLCPVQKRNTAFLTMPSHCSPDPLQTTVGIVSWEEPDTEHRRSAPSTDVEGNPVGIDGCAGEPFAPTISSRPTTNLTDSPSGLDFDLHQPQDTRLGHIAPANLKDATVTLPAGMSVNPAQADGLAACSQGEIGYLGEGHFSKQPQGCPAAAKLGTMEVTTPLLAEYSEDGTQLRSDPETGEAIPRPLQGSVYLAEPYENPFGSLLALYLVIEDHASGTIAKLGGEVKADPATGQLTTVVEENPELPLEDVKLHLFGGARGALTTPLVCATHTTTSDLVPWSTPEGADAHPTDSFQTTGHPGGGACPTSEGAAPNSPSFSAGTTSAQAGAYSPFVLKLSREDGTQRLTGLDTLLPPGLSGKLAGIGECSDAQIAQARSREHPNMGIEERNNPSCPASSEVGAVHVAAGSGPTPYWTTGHAYLAGPYKGAPLSLAVIVPAVAGPFDLGTVVTRVALQVDPATAQIHAVSDPFPTIIDGIPLDLRTVSLEMGRPQFTLNPTNCEPLAITGQATSALGNAASLSNRFQVGGCSALPFKPKLSLRLKGKIKRTSNPRLIANLTAKPGEANIARAQVKLPHSVFLDQSHIRTVCTRVQWAADACPPGSVYGSVWATTPLLDYKLAGSVYLRSSSHKLPDLVAKLKGPASQPIEIDLVGRTDAVKGALRNTFEAVPDAPVSHFHLELFGGKRGLVVMSSGFCKGRRANVQLDGQNGKAYDTRPVVAARCPKHRKHRGHGRHHKRGQGHGSKGARHGK